MNYLSNKKDLCVKKGNINLNVKIKFTFKLYHLIVKKANLGSW